MSEWQEYQLGDLTDWFSGGTPSKETAHFWTGPIPWISAKTMTNYKVCSSELMISKEGLDSGSRMAEINDILLLVRGSGLFNDIPISIVSDKVAFNQDIKAIRSKNTALQKYIFFWLHGNKKGLNDIMEETGIGAGKFETDLLKKLKIFIPESAVERDQIVETAQSIFDKIDLLHRNNKTLEEMAETLFRQWFVEGAKEEWEVVRLKDLGRIVCGKTPSTKNEDFFNGSIPFVKIPDMHGKVFILETSTTLTEKGAKSQLNKTIPQGAIMVSCIATVGLVSIATCDCQTNQQINSLIPENTNQRYFLFLLLRQFKEELKTLAGGGSVTDNLNTTDFGNITIALPAAEILNEFDKTVTLIFDKIHHNYTAIKSLSKSRDLLLPKLMSGEVRVKN